jgi:hypothetical protein
MADELSRSTTQRTRQSWQWRLLAYPSLIAIVFVVVAVISARRSSQSLTKPLWIDRLSAIERARGYILQIQLELLDHPEITETDFPRLLTEKRFTENFLDKSRLYSEFRVTVCANLATWRPKTQPPKGDPIASVQLVDKSGNLAEVLLINFQAQIIDSPLQSNLNCPNTVDFQVRTNQ